MLRRLTIFGALISIILSYSVFMSSRLPHLAAEDVETQWFYAFDIGSVELFAYTPDGQVNVLLSDCGFPTPLLLFPDGSALVMMTKWEDRPMFYHLTPTSAEPLDFEINREWEPIAQTDRYGLLTAKLTQRPAVIYDNRTRTFEYLPENWTHSLDVFRFSADGEYLRYLRRPDELGGAWEIIDRQLETSQERVVYSVEHHPAIWPFVLPIPDEFGERWFWTWGDRDTDIRQTDLIHIDGSVETLIDGTSEVNAYFSMQDHQFLESPINCAVVCTITVHRLDDTPITVQSNFLEVDSLDIIDATGILISRAGHHWLLTTDAAPRYLGYMRDRWHDSLFQIASPDHRWLTVFDREEHPQSILIWDLSTRQLSARFEHADGYEVSLSEIYYRPNGLVFSTYYPDTAIWFHYDSGEMTHLPYPENEYRTYFELLPDDSFLGITHSRHAEAGTSQQYWRYDPAMDTLSLTLPQGWWFPLRFPAVEQPVFVDP